MENSHNAFNCERARQVEIVDYLAALGRQPDKIKGHQYWYKSLFRTERTAQ